MFGYIKPNQSELKVSELEVYKSVYCGLCKSLGKHYGAMSRLTLSYDFTFLAILILGLKESCDGFDKKRCPLNPLKKKLCVNPSDDLSFVSAVAMIMLYYKLKDDIFDKSFFKRIPLYFMLPTFSRVRKKAKKAFPEVNEKVGEMIKKQIIIEKQQLDVEKYSEPTSVCLGQILEMVTENEQQKKVLYRVGFLTGRFIYLIDAVDDLKKDIKNKEFNPFKQQFLEDEKNTIKKATELINITLGDLALSYQLLDFNRYKGILDNIIYLGLNQTKQNVLNKYEKETENG